MTESPSDLTTSDWKQVLRRVRDEFRSDHVTLTSSGVAFFLFVSLVPLLAASVSVYGLIADTSDVAAFADRLGPSVPDAVRGVLRQQLTSIVEADSGALGLGAVVGFVSGLWTASSGFDKLIEGLNIAYDARRSRSFVKRRLVALASTLATTAIVAVSITLVRFASGIADGVLNIVALGVAWMLVAGVFATGLAVIYRYAPERDRPQWEWVTIGSVFSVIAWTLVSFAFGVYISLFGSFNETYGSLGAIVIVLMWLYLSTAVVMIGAELNSEAQSEAG